MKTRQPWNTTVFAVAAVLGLGGCQSPSPVSQESAEQVYRESCLLCHVGTGAGASAPDLTTLSRANGGTFPMAEVTRIIDGRGDVRPHDSPMPVWGDHLDADLIRDIAAYLESIQQ